MCECRFFQHIFCYMPVAHTRRVTESIGSSAAQQLSSKRRSSHLIVVCFFYDWHWHKRQWFFSLFCAYDNDYISGLGWLDIDSIDIVVRFIWAGQPTWFTSISHMNTLLAAVGVCVHAITYGFLPAFPLGLLKFQQLPCDSLTFLSLKMSLLVLLPHFCVHSVMDGLFSFLL